MASAASTNGWGQGTCCRVPLRARIICSAHGTAMLALFLQACTGVGSGWVGNSVGGGECSGGGENRRGGGLGGRGEAGDRLMRLPASWCGRRPGLQTSRRLAFSRPRLDGPRRGAEQAVDGPSSDQGFAQNSALADLHRLPTAAGTLLLRSCCLWRWGSCTAHPPSWETEQGIAANICVMGPTHCNDVLQVMSSNRLPRCDRRPGSRE